VSRVIIGLTGRAGSGKSTAARILREQHGFVELTFKSGIIRPLCVLFGVPSTVFEEDKEVPNAALCGRTPRQIMQTFGTEWGRNLVHRNIWVDLLRRELEGYPDRDIVISDVRFNNEAAFLRAVGGRVFAVRRNPDTPQRWWAKLWAKLWRRAQHSSEQGIGLTFIECHIDNRYDLKHLEKEVLNATTQV
jgi:hypothetical protein